MLMSLSWDDVNHPPCGVTVNVSVVVDNRPAGRERIVASGSAASLLSRHRPLAVFLMAFSEKLRPKEERDSLIEYFKKVLILELYAFKVVKRAFNLLSLKTMKNHMNQETLSV